MIVVNSVMAGFSHEMQTRMNGAMGDIILEVRSLDGVADAEAHMERIRRVGGADVVAMSPTVKVPGLMYIETSGGLLTRQVVLVGIDEQKYAQVSRFGEYLQHPENRKQLSFALREEGFDVYDHSSDDPENLKPRTLMGEAGWRYRRQWAAAKQRQQMYEHLPEAPDQSKESATVDPFAQMAKESGAEQQGQDFNPAQKQHVGIVLGMALCSYRDSEGYDNFQALPGSDVRVSFPTASLPAKVMSEYYTVVDFYESKMSEFDANFAFVPLRALQESRGMIDRTTGIGNFTEISVKLRGEADAEAIRDRMRAEFPSQLYAVSTWRDQQHPILQAVRMETAVLNVLLFLIIAVAGFGIMAIFYMIVVEKTRDIGILKSLGASGLGVMGTFLAYGLSLGIVGAGVGLLLGISFVRNINEIANGLSRLTGQPVFDPSVYYFSKIPTVNDPLTITLVCLGAVLIAVLASVLPACRAARLHPVSALRFE
jgi:lipoprotein-releasing system permease protein